MTDMMKTENLFKPMRSRAETKHDVTDNVARGIIGDEVARREAKTAKLREARMAMEAREQEVAAAAKAAAGPKAKATKKKSAVKR